MTQNIQPEDVAQFAACYYVGVRNAHWANAEKTQINCEVNFSHVGFEEWTPFTADPKDYMPYSRPLFDELCAGKWGEVAPFVGVAVEVHPVADTPTVTTTLQPVSLGVQTF